MLTDYSEVQEGLRVVDCGTIKYKILLDRTVGLWHVEVDKGPVPVALRGKYTGPSHALLDIKKYVAGTAERKIVYKQLPRKNKEA